MDRKIALIIDGPHTVAVSRSLRLKIDYKEFRRWVSGRGNLRRCYFVAAVDESEEFMSIRPLLDWLDYNGFDVASTLEEPSHFAMQMAVTAFDASQFADEIVLLAGSSWYAPLVFALRRRGIQVRVISTMSGEIVSNELRRAGDEFIDLESIRNDITAKN